MAELTPEQRQRIEQTIAKVERLSALARVRELRAELESAADRESGRVEMAHQIRDQYQRIVALEAEHIPREDRERALESSLRMDWVEARRLLKLES